MNPDRIIGRYKQFPAHCGSLIGVRALIAASDREHSAGKTQARYGITRDVTEKLMREFHRFR